MGSHMSETASYMCHYRKLFCLEFARDNSDIILQGRLADLVIGGQVLDVDTTDILNVDYDALLRTLRSALERVSPLRNG